MTFYISSFGFLRLEKVFLSGQRKKPVKPLQKPAKFGKIHVR